MQTAASEAWSRGIRAAALGALAYGGINGVVSRLSVGVPSALLYFALYSAIAFLILTPLCALGFYCARRWVGIEVAPWIWARQEPVTRLLLVVGAAGLALFIGSILLALAFAPLLSGGTGPIDDLAKLSVLGRLVVSTTAFWEEEVFRLALLFPLIALLGVRQADRTRRPPAQVWAAILVTGLLFALAHAGNITGAGAQGYLIFSVVQKGVFVSGVLGYLTWRYGIEAAILAHFSLDAIALLI